MACFRSVTKTLGTTLALLALACTDGSAEAGEFAPPDASGGGAGGDTAQTARPALGTPCAGDGDCPADATCLRQDGQDYFGGGPPRGVCVADCGPDPGRCSEFADAVCVSMMEAPDGSAAYCFPSCTPGVPDLEKCGGQADVACDRLAASPDEGFCRLFCTHDDECPERRCDRARGVCTDSPPNPGSFGQPCDPEADDTGCPGVCVELGDAGYAVCSRRCLYGSVDACNGSAEAPAFCAFASPGGSLGDTGYCSELCDCTSECSHAEAICDPFSSESVRELVGRAGVCAPEELAEEELVCDE